MSRNDLFLLVACATALAIMSGGPMPHAASGTFASVAPPSQYGTRTADIGMLQHSFDRQ